MCGVIITCVDGCMRDMKATVGNLGARLKVRGIELLMVVSLFADNTVFLAENEWMLLRMVDEFEWLCICGKF